MGKMLKFIENKEPLKLVIMEYMAKQIDIVNYSDEYYIKHRDIFKRPAEKKTISDREFFERLNNYLYIEKVTELLITLYLEDLKGNNPTIYELNRFLKRTSNQYSATFKQVDKLEKLDIVYTKQVKESPRKEKRVYINKEITTIYGDDEFRRMMLAEWDTDAKEYIKRKLNGLLKDKEEFEKRILMVKKGKRVKNN